MSLIQWDPWDELEQLRARTDLLWDEFLGRLSLYEPAPEPIAFLPDVDFVETLNEYRLYLSVPGLIEEDIDLLIDENALTVRGQRECPYDETHARARVHEWRYGCFERRVQFPYPIRPADVRANYDAGVLSIVLPKA